MKPHSLGWKIQTRLRSWLAIHRDAEILGGKAEDTHEAVERVNARLDQMVTVINQTNSFLADARRRLAFYEQTIPELASARAVWDSRSRSATKDGVTLVPGADR